MLLVSWTTLHHFALTLSLQPNFQWATNLKVAKRHEDIDLKKKVESRWSRWFQQLPLLVELVVKGLAGSLHTKAKVTFFVVASMLGGMGNWMHFVNVGFRYIYGPVDVFVVQRQCLHNEFFWVYIFTPCTFFTHCISPFLPWLFMFVIRRGRGNHDANWVHD